MRDYLCDETELKEMLEYFQMGIDRSINEIKVLEEDIKSGFQRYPSPPERIIENHHSSLCYDSRELFMAEYTYGKDCNDIEEDYRKACKYALQVGYEDFGYVNMLHYITAGILFEISKQK